MNRKTGNISSGLSAALRGLVTVAAWTFFGLSGFAAQAATTAYMTSKNGDFGTVNLTTGGFTLLGNSGITLAGLAGEDGVLFGTSVYTNPSILYRINVANGAVTAIGQIGAMEIAVFGSTSNALYGLDTSSTLYSIDPKTGAGTLIGQTNVSLGGFYTLSTNTEKLYLASGTTLYVLNTATGVGSQVGSTGGPEFGALLEENGVLYAGQDSGALSVDTINVTTGLATVGPGLTGQSSEFYGFGAYPVSLGTTSTVLTTNSSSGTTGTSIVFTATVKEKIGFLSVPSGTVTFMNHNTVLGSATLNASGVATLTTTALPAGSNSITAVYKGDARNATSTSSAVSVSLKIVVPNVVGQTQANASTSITKVGLTVGAVTKQSSATVPAGSVASQNPAAGTSVAGGVAVNLSISTGPAPGVSLSASSLSFANQTVNTSSAVKSITLKNSGTGTLSLTSVTLTGSQADDFSLSKTCAGTLSANASCTISVTFKPVSTGVKNASLAISDNASGSPQAVAVTGTGITASATPQVKLSAASIAFGNGNVGVTSPAKSVTLTNSGTGTLSLTSIAVTGGQADDYALSKTCGSTVAANASCTLSVTFKPVSTGVKTASLSIADNASGSPQIVSLSGTGITASSGPSVKLSTTSISFGNQAVGTTSAAKSVTLTNSGTQSLTLSSITLTGGQADDYALTKTCGATLAASGSCIISVTFKPVSNGTKSAAISIADNANASPQNVAVSGAGITAASSTPL